MADSKISALTALVAADVDTSADLMAIVDTSVTTTKKISIDNLRGALLSQTAITNSLAADVDLSNTSNYFTGPTCAQGTVGTWFASGTVVVQDTAGAAAFHIKLWDGTTVIASAVCNTAAAGNTFSVSLSGYLASPAGNIRISAKDISSTSGKLLYNTSGTSKDCTLSVVRIG